MLLTLKYHNGNIIDERIVKTFCFWPVTAHSLCQMPDDTHFDGEERLGKEREMGLLYFKMF